MQEQYEFLEFLTDNSISYRKTAIDPTGDSSDIASFYERRKIDQSTMEEDDFFEEYFEETPMLNGTEDILIFETTLNNGLRLFRDSMANSTFKIHPDNKTDLVTKLSGAFSTLTFYQTSISNDVIEATRDDDFEFPRFSILSKFIDPKVKTIGEVLKLLGADTQTKSKVRAGAELKSALTKNQIVILVHNLVEAGVFSNQLSQTQLSSLVSQLTGISSESLRQAYSAYKTFNEQPSNGNHFPETDFNAVRRVLKGIMQQWEKTGNGD